jgi:hypothetical protein
MGRLFLPGADANSITIKRGEFVIRLSPAEVDKATHLVGVALGMETMDALPDHISGTPFVIRFFEDDRLALERTDNKGSVPFTWAEADDLILALHDGKKIAVNERTLIKGPRSAGKRVTFSDEPFTR